MADRLQVESDSLTFNLVKPTEIAILVLVVGIVLIFFAYFNHRTVSIGADARVSHSRVHQRSAASHLNIGRGARIRRSTATQ